MKNRLAASDRRENEPMSPAVAQANNIQTKSIGSRLAEKLFGVVLTPDCQIWVGSAGSGSRTGAWGFSGLSSGGSRTGGGAGSDGAFSEKIMPA